MWAEVNGRRLEYDDAGGDGPPVLVGLAGGAGLHQPGIGALSDVWRVIRCSPGTSDPWERARDLLGLLDHLGIERAVVVGVGDGASPCVRCALLSPDRIRGLVAVGVDGPGGRHELADRLEEIEAPALVIRGAGADTVAAARARELCDGLHDCRGVVRIDGATDAPLATHPDAVLAALRPFLEELPG